MENAGVAQVAGDLEKHEFHPWFKICSLCINCRVFFFCRPVSFIYGSRWLILFIPLHGTYSCLFSYSVLLLTHISILAFCLQHIQKGRTVFYWIFSWQNRIAHTSTSQPFRVWGPLLNFRKISWAPILIVVLPGSVDWKKYIMTENYYSLRTAVNECSVQSFDSLK